RAAPDRQRARDRRARVRRTRGGRVLGVGCVARHRLGRGDARLRALRGRAFRLAAARAARRVDVREDAAVRLVAGVLHWNGGEDPPRALESLAGIETVCVDNGSTDGSDLEIERRFPEVELVRNGANLGFAGGSNVGIARALERGADWVLLVNNDAVVERGL